MTTVLPSTFRARLTGLGAAPLFAPTILAVAFLCLAAAMTLGETHTLDLALLEALRAPGAPHEPVGPAWLDVAVKDLTSLGSTSVLALLTILATGFLWVLGRRGAAFAVVAAAMGGAALSTLLKSTFERPRPAFIADGVSIDTWSFPSGHAMLSAVIYLTLGALLADSASRRRLKAYILATAITVTLMIGASRVYLGVHYPSDVLGGWCIGAAWALLCRAIAARLQVRDRGPDAAR